MNQHVSNIFVFLFFCQGSQPQLIFYTRPDQEGPKLSDFQFSEVIKPDLLKVFSQLSVIFEVMLKPRKRH